MWVWMAHACLDANHGNAVFLENKIMTARFYFAYLLPEIDALARRIRAGSKAIMSIAEDRL